MKIYSLYYTTPRKTLLVATSNDKSIFAPLALKLMRKLGKDLPIYTEKKANGKPHFFIKEVAFTYIEPEPTVNPKAVSNYENAVEELCKLFSDKVKIPFENTGYWFVSNYKTENGEIVDIAISAPEAADALKHKNFNMHTVFDYLVTKPKNISISAWLNGRR